MASSKNELNAIPMSEISLNTTRPYTASGSATGNPRNKTALKPGHSLMDWIRLGHSGQDLTGVKGIPHIISLEELAKHNTEDDCWLALRGTVYNVTHYMEFHPGGMLQLMKGAGKDATEMFDQVHAYVNYNSILQKCVVGRLLQSKIHRVSDIDELSLKDSDTVINFKLPTSSSKASFKMSPSTHTEPATTVLLPMDWYQKEDSINLVFYTKIPNPGIKVHLDEKLVSVSIKLRGRVVLSTLTLSNKVKWPCTICINDIGKVDIEFMKLERGQWSTYGTPCEGSVIMSPGEERRDIRVIDSISVTYNTKLIILRYDEQHYDWVPIGHHLLVHYNAEVEKLVRMYTPVPPHLHPDFRLAKWTPDCVCLMVKEYATGAVSPWICNLKPKDVVQVSGPEGHFRTQMVKDCTHLYMIAAGTGITPMLGLILWTLEGKKKKSTSVNLLFFNRTPADILWREQMEKLSQTDQRFSVTHILSEPDGDWKGGRGHVDEICLKNFLPQPTVEPSLERHNFVTVCGPTLFTQITRELIDKLGFSENQFHCFVG